MDAIFKMMADLGKTVFAAAMIVIALRFALDAIQSGAPTTVVLLSVGVSVWLIALVWLALKRNGTRDESNEHI